MFKFTHEPIKEDLLELMPNYFKNVKNEFLLMLEAFQSEDYRKMRLICHKVLGTAQSYGLNQLDILMTQMRNLIDSGDFNRGQIKSKLDEINQYFDFLSKEYPQYNN